MIPRPTPALPLRDPFARAPSVPDVRILFTSVKLPEGVIGLPNAHSRVTAHRYEADVQVSGGVSGRFKGSIYPDNMTTSGRLQNGTYDIYLGFHDRDGGGTKLLEVRTNYLRAALIIGADRPLPVVSHDPKKLTAAPLHIHNGYNTWWIAGKDGKIHHMSDGCLTIAPWDWPRFIKSFFQVYPDPKEWTCAGGFVGRKIGTVTVFGGVRTDANSSPGRTMYA